MNDKTGKELTSELAERVLKSLDELSDKQLYTLNKEINKFILGQVDTSCMDDESAKAIIGLSHDHMLYEAMLISLIVSIRKRN